VNRLARASRDGFWTGIGCGGLLIGIPVILGTLIVAFAVNPGVGVVATVLLLLFLTHGSHRRRRRS